MNFKQYLESKLPEEKVPSLNERIKEIVKDQLDTSCSISVSKKKDLMELATDLKEYGQRNICIASEILKNKQVSDG